jgi:hypothetical protein
MDERFGKRDLPHIIGRHLQDLRQFQEKSLEEYANRAQELATGGYPGTQDSFIQIVATDTFLKGCSDKKPALTPMDKDPTDLDTALQYAKSAVTNQRVIIGIKKSDIGVKRVTFQESDMEGETELDEESLTSIRSVYRKETGDEMYKSLESQIKKTDNDLQEKRSAVLQVLDILKHQIPSSPQRTSPRQSPTRIDRCFDCSVEGHYSAQCDKPINRSLQRYNPRLRYPSPKKGSLNFNGLRP